MSRGAAPKAVDAGSGMQGDPVRGVRRMMFLGNRRLAWEALQLLRSDRFRARFDVRAVVSDDLIRDRLADLGLGGDVGFISNASRQSALLAQTIRAQRIDLLLSVQHNWILPPEVLDLVQGQAFNLHNARLPDYKGYNSVSHAIANGDATYASTLHWMTAEVDSGDLAYVAQVPIHQDDTAVSLYARTVDAALSAVAALLRDLAAGAPVPRTPMPPGAGAFHGRGSVRDLANVTGKSDPAEIARLARATYFPPFNAAYLEHGGARYYLLPAAPAEQALREVHPANMLTSGAVAPARDL